MDALRMADVTARLVAWHNRQPLARRIAPADVSGIGVVALPFAGPPLAGPPFAGPPDAAPGPARLQPLFGPEWMFRTAGRHLDRWASRHAGPVSPGLDGWPSRQIDADLARSHAADAAGLSARTLRHVLTAVIDSGGHRVRVLLSPPAAGSSMHRAAVFGQRIGSPRRGAAAAGLLVAGLLVWLLPGTGGHPPPVARTVRAGVAGPPVAAAASASTAASVPAPTPASTPAPTPVPTPPPETAVAEAVAPAAAETMRPRPPDVPITLLDRRNGAAPLVALRPRLGEAERRSARLAATSVRLSAIGTPPLDGRMFAVATLPARTRDDAAAQQVALRGLLAQSTTTLPTQLDVMPAGRGWRVVWWPHPEREQAELLLLQARARGLKVELIDF